MHVSYGIKLCNSNTQFQLCGAFPLAEQPVISLDILACAQLELHQF